jgi:hypothetical protein
MFCTKCGKEVKEGLKVCPECGAKIDSPQSAIDAKGLLGVLLDASFNNFIAVKIIRIIYKIEVVLSILAGITVFIGSFFVVRLWGIILGPIAGFLIFFIMLVLARIWCELMIVLFKIAEDVAVIAKEKRRGV